MRLARSGGCKHPGCRAPSPEARSEPLVGPCSPPRRVWRLRARAQEGRRVRASARAKSDPCWVLQLSPRPPHSRPVAVMPDPTTSPAISCMDTQQQRETQQSPMQEHAVYGSMLQPWGPESTEPAQKCVPSPAPARTTPRHVSSAPAATQPAVCVSCRAGWSVVRVLAGGLALRTRKKRLRTRATSAATSAAG